MTAAHCCFHYVTSKGPDNHNHRFFKLEKDIGVSSVFNIRNTVNRLML